jgi:purine-binding chemotaxis protein CheW
MYVGKKHMVMLLDVDKLLDPEELEDIARLPLSEEGK